MDNEIVMWTLKEEEKKRLAHYVINLIRKTEPFPDCGLAWLALVWLRALLLLT